MKVARTERRLQELLSRKAVSGWLRNVQTDLVMVPSRKSHELDVCDVENPIYL